MSALIAAQINAAVKVAELHTESMHAANRVRREQGYQDAYEEEAFSRTADALAASVRALAAAPVAETPVPVECQWEHMTIRVRDGAPFLIGGSPDEATSEAVGTSDHPVHFLELLGELAALGWEYLGLHPAEIATGIFRRPRQSAKSDGAGDAVIAAAVEWAGRIDGAPDADYRAQAESADRLVEAVRCYEAALRQKVGA